MKRFTLFLLMVFGAFLVKAQPYTTSYGEGAGTMGSNSFYGYEAGRITTGGGNSFFGTGTGWYNTTGFENVFIGSNAGRYNTEGNYNSFVGINTGYANTTGIMNSFFGRYAGRHNTTGRFNTYIGVDAGRHNTEGHYNTCIGVSAGNNNSGSNNVFIGRQAGMNETGSNKLYISNSTTNNLIYGEFDNQLLAFNATVRIGEVTDQPAGYKLFVKDGILTEKLKIANVDSEEWADFVFEENYDLCAIEEVEDFVKTNKHLPNIPSADDVEKHGVDVVEMDAALLRQIEELWLHMMEVNDRVKDLEAENEMLKTRLESISK